MIPLLSDERISEAIQMGDFKWVPTNNEQFWDFVTNCAVASAQAQRASDIKEFVKLLGETLDEDDVDYLIELLKEEINETT